MKLFLFVALQLAYLQWVCGTPTGAPGPAVLINVPYHGCPPNENTVKDVKLTVTRTNYTPNVEIIVKLEAVSKNFRGFLLTAKRETGEVQQPIGMWSKCDQDAKYLTYAAPNNGANNSATHKARNEKNIVECTWTAPNTDMGNVVINAVIAFSKCDYHTKNSVTITNAGSNGPNPTAMLTKIPDVPNCGKRANCIFFPTMCELSGTCKIIVSFAPVDNTREKVMFHAAIKKTPEMDWLGISISEDDKMVDDQFIICGTNPNNMLPMVQTSYGAKHCAQPSFQPNDITDRKAGMVNDGGNWTTCSFIMSKAFSNVYTDMMQKMARNITFMTSKEYYIMVANGKFIKGTYGLSPHPQLPMVRSSKIMLNSNTFKIYYLNGVKKQIKIHATLNLVAWVFLVPLASMIMAHMRPNFTAELLKKQAWFWLHVVFMVVGTIVSIAGVIYMLVYNMAWKSKPQVAAHGIIGLIMLAFALVQVGGGIFRPSPDHRRRKCWNYFHHVSGYLTRILSVITMWLAVTLEYLDPSWRFWMAIVLGVWTGVEVIFILCFLAKRMVVYQEYLSDYYRKQIYGEKMPEPWRSRFVDHLPTLAFAFYVFVVVCLFICFIVGMYTL